MKSAPVAAGGARAALSSEEPCKKIEGKEGWTRIVFCLDRVTLPLEPALEAALLQKGISEARLGPARTPRSRSIEAPNTDAREVERLARQRMAELLRRGVLEPSMVHAFLNDEVRTAGATGTKSRNDE